MAEGGRVLYSVVEADNIRATESVIPGNVTRDVAEALMVLHGTPLRSDAEPSVGLTYPGSADDVSSLRLSSCLPSCRDTIGYTSQAARSRYESLFPDTYAVSFSRDNTTLSWALPTTATSSWNTPISDSSIMFANRGATPITSASGSQSAVETDRDRVAELEARLRYTESLLERALKLDNAASTTDGAHDNYLEAVHSLTTENVHQLPASVSGVAVRHPLASTRRPGESPQHARGDCGSQHVTKTYVPHVKLGVFKGDTSLETFLAKFENCSRYLNWNEQDRFFHLSNALEGTAGQVLWDADNCRTVQALIQLLRSRFGSQNQNERFRAELKSRRRKPGESLQKLHQDVCRLMALAYPGPSSELSDIIARDAFLDALDDPKLRREILIQQPKTLETALSIASRLEAYDRELSDDQEVNGRGARMKDKRIRTAKVSPLTAVCNTGDGDLSRRVDVLQSKLDEVLLKLNTVHQPVTDASSPTRLDAPATPFHHTRDRPVSENMSSVGRDTCRNCLQKGHWAKFCPHAKSHGTNVNVGNSRKWNNQTNVITGAEAKRAPTAVYLKVRVNHRVVYGLLT